MQTQPVGPAEVELLPVEVQIRPMLTLSRALDHWLDDLERRDYSARTIIEYGRYLGLLCDSVPSDMDVSRITLDQHIQPFLRRYRNRSKSTKATVESAVCSFFSWLRFQGKVTRDPCDMLVRTRRPQSEDLDVVTVSTDDVRRMRFLAEGWPERLALDVAIYLGPRRSALSQLRIQDYDRGRGRIRFREKGGKPIYKPIPGKLDMLIEEALADGVYDDQDYLVPSPRPEWIRRPDRDAAVIYRLIRRIARRAEVTAHVHSLRAAFACFYLEATDGDIVGLKELMGHKHLATTEIYLRKMNKQKAMEPVRSLSWDVADSDSGPSRESRNLRREDLSSTEDPSGVTANVRKPSSRMDTGLESKGRDGG